MPPAPPTSTASPNRVNPAVTARSRLSSVPPVTTSPSNPLSASSTNSTDSESSPTVTDAPPVAVKVSVAFV